MKSIFLLRHAHAVVSQDNDFDRPLSDEGILKCQAIALNLKPYIQDIDLILSSPALRTSQTIENILLNLGVTNKIHYDQVLYNSSVNRLLQYIAKTPVSNKNILIVSHNPAISQIGRFLGHSKESLQGFSPGSLALFQAEIDSWNLLDPSNVSLKEFWR